ncbi:MAG: WecB/TagA/CpsF family glycosyltransferase [Armatimonadota bacterium]|nr:WecB/TagA/CpsF family glycosyltransferase [Armatimonadota bacterium]MCX7776537.1 WecB/TagA/CpsF family glycosyltransferase [Armatimonadota bacterium]MDW8024336.1 WecB/TagA/CpsF family glycosyltransferase [Armatimonadota bacterium]
MLPEIHSQAALKAVWQSAIVVGCVSFMLALLCGGLVYAIHMKKLCERRFTLFGGDLAALLSLAAPIALLLTFSGAEPANASVNILLTLILSIVLLTFIGWLIVLIPKRMHKVAVLLRLIAVATCATLLALSGISFDVVKIPLTTKFVGLGFFAIPFSVAWMALLTITFQMTARVPCLSLGIGAISSLTLSFAAAALPQRMTPLAMLLSGITFGACMGLLPWAMMLGQAMTTFATASSIGILLSAISVSGALKNTALLIVIVPVLALGIPFIEVTCALCDALISKSGVKRMSLFELLISEGLVGRRLWVVLVLTNAYLCIIAMALVALVRIHFALKLLVLLSLGFFAVALIYALSKLLSQRQPSRSTIELLGIPISTLGWEQTLERIMQFISEGTPHMIVTADTSAIVRAQEDEEFKRILRGADLVTPDGIGVVMAARLLGEVLTQRISGVDLMNRLCALAAEKGYRVFFLGAKNGVAELAAKRLSQMHPGLQVVGTHHGYFSDDEERDIVRIIKESKPHILFVAMGIPKQEKWIAKHMSEIGVPVSIGVGGSFDVYAGLVKRAPKWVQYICMEWLYRALREPYRFKRLIAIPKLLLQVAKAIVRRL